MGNLYLRGPRLSAFQKLRAAAVFVRRTDERRWWRIPWRVVIETRPAGAATPGAHGEPRGWALRVLLIEDAEVAKLMSLISWSCSVFADSPGAYAPADARSRRRRRRRRSAAYRQATAPVWPRHDGVSPSTFAHVDPDSLCPAWARGRCQKKS